MNLRADVQKHAVSCAYGMHLGPRSCLARTGSSFRRGARRASQSSASAAADLERLGSARNLLWHASHATRPALFRETAGTEWLALLLERGLLAGNSNPPTDIKAALEAAIASLDTRIESFATQPGEARRAGTPAPICFTASIEPRQTASAGHVCTCHSHLQERPAGNRNLCKELMSAIVRPNGHPVHHERSEITLFIGLVSLRSYRRSASHRIFVSEGPST